MGANGYNTIVHFRDQVPSVKWLSRERQARWRFSSGFIFERTRSIPIATPGRRHLRFPCSFFPHLRSSKAEEAKGKGNGGAEELQAFTATPVQQVECRGGGAGWGSSPLSQGWTSCSPTWKYPERLNCKAGSPLVQTWRTSAIMR